jgi:hypothetical protein
MSRQYSAPSTARESRDDADSAAGARRNLRRPANMAGMPLTAQATEALHPEPVYLSDAELARIAEAGGALEQRLALQLLRDRWGFRTIRKLLGVYEPERVKQAWRMTFEAMGEST